MCDRGYSSCNIFFGGSYPTNINIPGPLPKKQSPMWTTDQSGSPLSVVPYPGNEYVENVDGKLISIVPGKMQQAINAQGLLSDDNVNLIGYSSGTESALMYAEWRLENGQDVNSIVLLGPTFNTSEMGFDNPDGGWGAVMDGLIEQGVNIYVFDDGLQQNVANGYVAPVGENFGVYLYVPRVIWHYSEHPKRPFGQGTNNSPSLKKEIYSWLAKPQ